MKPLMGDMGGFIPTVYDCEPMFWFGLLIGMAGTVLLIIGGFYISGPRQ